MKYGTTIRKSVALAMGTLVLGAFSGQAAAISPATLPVITNYTVDTVSGNAPKRAWSDYGTSKNYGWTHTAQFRIFQVGTTSDITAGTRFDVNVELKANSSAASPMNFPGFSIWTSGTTPMVVGSANGNGYGHAWSQVRGGKLDGGVADDPCGQGGDCTLGSNGWLGTGGGGNILDGHDGWIGYANAGYSFQNGDGDYIQGLFAGSSNPSNIGQYGGGASDPLNGTTLTNVNGSSPYVNGGSASLSSGDALLSLYGLKAGYYLIGYAGSCPDNNDNGQGCATSGAQAYNLTVSAVPLPAAFWLFGSALTGLGVFGRKKSKS